MANAIVVVPQYLNVLEGPPAAKGAAPAAAAPGAPTNGGAAAQPVNGGGASAGVTLLASGAPEDAKAEANPAEGGSALVAQGGPGLGLGAGAAPRLEMWQVLSAHEAGQCQLWHDGGDGLRPVAVIGVKCAPARRVPCTILFFPASGVLPCDDVTAPGTCWDAASGRLLLCYMGVCVIHIAEHNCTALFICM